VWNTIVSTAATIHHTLLHSVPLTDEAEELLSNLSDKLSSRYDDNDPEHLALLSGLWTGLFAGSPFERNSIRWKEAGFQGPDPVKDLKQSGILALECMLYMSKNYTQRTQTMLNTQKPNAATNYPFAIVGVNTTLLLATIISLKDQRYLSAQACYWKFFEAPEAFYELFVVCFFHLDHLWRHRKATRADFSRIIGIWFCNVFVCFVLLSHVLTTTTGEIKVLITNSLNRAPKSIEDLKYIAQEESMVIT
jgi:hypothetical protein